MVAALPDDGAFACFLCASRDTTVVSCGASSCCVCASESSSGLGSVSLTDIVRLEGIEPLASRPEFIIGLTWCRMRMSSVPLKLAATRPWFPAGRRVYSLEVQRAESVKTATYELACSRVFVDGRLIGSGEGM